MECADITLYRANPNHIVNLTLTPQTLRSTLPKRAGGMDAAKPVLQKETGGARA
jgi:hypothetical protein